MKKIILILLFLSLFSSQYLYSQSGWALIDPGYNQVYNSVHFINANTGMACGLNGVIIKTTNGGMNWTDLPTGVSTSLNDIKMFNTDCAIAVSDYQLIIRTTNGGSNWILVHPAVSEDHSIQNLNVFNNSQAMAFSEYYYSSSYYRYIYKTTDLGASWQINPTYVSGSWIHFIDVNTGWAYGSTHYGPPLNEYYLDINKTINGGTNWSLICRGSGISINPGQIYFYNSNIGMKYSHIGTVYLMYSNDGGYNWNGTGLSLNQLIRCFYFVNAQKGWFVGDNSMIYYSSNSGVNWTQQTSPINTNFQKVYFIDENTGWIAAGYSGILKTTTGGILGIIKLGTDSPNSFSLSQNYPNPFNPTTKIKFDIAPSPSGEGRGEVVTLKIYDILGREVATLVNEELKPGSYKYQWDGSNFASGVYFYQLITNDFSQTKKMIIMK